LHGRFLDPQLRAERTEPAEPLAVRDGSVGRRRRRKNEEAGRAEPALLQAVPGPLPEDAFVGRLADEGDDFRAELLRKALETLRGTGEVAAAEVAASLRRPVGGVR
jgi:hypothetical protein